MSHPAQWRQSTYSEIQQYYEEEFPEQIEDLPDWITPNSPKQYALAFRERYPAQYGDEDDVPPRDFIRRDTRNSDNPDQIFIEDWDQLLTFFRKPAARDPLAVGTNRALGLIHPDNEAVSQPAPAPAAAYYGLDNWDEFWVLAFDIDAKDVAKQSIAGGDQTYEDVTDKQVENAGIISTPPTTDTLPPEAATGSVAGSGSVATYKYRFEDIERTLHYAFELKRWLKDEIKFDEVRVFYSGQGAHVYARKDDPYYKYTLQTRRFLTTYIRERLHIPIDEAVTWDRQRVMRLPYSLHTDVNRVVTEIDTPKFDFRRKAIPEITTRNAAGDQP